MTCHKENCGCTNSAADITKKLKDFAQRLQDDPNGTAHQAGQELRMLLDSAGDNLHDVSETVTAQIHRKPVEASFIALGVGALIGLLLGRR